MAELFSHTDNDGDVAWLSESGRSQLILRAPRGAELDHAAATALRDALTAWLGGALTPAPTAPVTVDDVRTLIAEALAEARAGQVQPLWTAPQTEVPFCEIPDCLKFPATAKHFEHDPEPGDVGHPRPAADPVDAALADPAVNWSDRLFGKSVPVKVPRQLVGCECGHRWDLHDEGGCFVIGHDCKCHRTPPVAS